MGKKVGAICLMILALQPLTAGADDSGWRKLLGEKLSQLNAGQPGAIGIYVKDLGSGESFSLRGEEVWYLASGVKVPVAMELLRKVGKGNLSLDKKVRVRESDYIDGNGEINFLKPGSRVSLRLLLDQMIIHSDNTATDLILREVGLKNVNAFVKRLVGGDFQITTLADVRRHAYSAIHPAAFRLKNNQLIQVRGTDRARVRKIASLLELAPEDIAGKSLDSAFSAYYGTHLNSAKLSTYGELLELLARGKALGEDETEMLLGIMSRVETGKNRIRAGLGREFVWAHKTGTQYSRICDFGLAWPRKQPERKAVIASCARGFLSRESAEDALRKAGLAIRESLFAGIP